MELAGIIGITGSITGILGVGFTFYAKMKDSELKLKEHEFKREQFKEDKQHQITKEKYQELFSKKIEIYTILHKELYRFHSKIVHVGKEQFEVIDNEGNYKKVETTKHDVMLGLWKSINSQLKDNLFLISNDLEQQYQKILLGYDKALVSFNEAEYHRPLRDKEDYEEVYQEVMLSFFTEYEEEINALILILEKEIKAVKSDLGFDS